MRAAARRGGSPTRWAHRTRDHCCCWPRSARDPGLRVIACEFLRVGSQLQLRSRCESRSKVALLRRQNPPMNNLLPLLLAIAHSLGRCECVFLDRAPRSWPPHLASNWRHRRLMAANGFARCCSSLAARWEPARRTQTGSSRAKSQSQLESSSSESSRSGSAARQSDGTESAVEPLAARDPARRCSNLAPHSRKEAHANANPIEANATSRSAATESHTIEMGSSMRPRCTCAARLVAGARIRNASASRAH